MNAVEDAIRQISIGLRNRIHRLETKERSSSQAIEVRAVADTSLTSVSGTIIAGTEVVLEPGLYQITGVYDFATNNNVTTDDGYLAVGQLLVNNVVMPDSARMLLIRPLDINGARQSLRSTVSQTWLVAVWDYSQLVLVDGAWAHWRLNDLVSIPSIAYTLDVTGNQRNGTIVSALSGQPPAFNTDLDDSIPYSMYFDGSASYIFANTNDLINGTRGSLEVWFKTSRAAIQHVYGNGNIDTHRNGCAIYLDATGHLKGDVTDVAAADTVTSAGTYNDGQWHHAVLTWDANAVRLYADTVQVASKAQTTLPTNTNTVWAGRTPVAGTNYFLGYIAEAAAYNTDLTASQLKNHYNLAKGQTNFPTTLYKDEIQADSPLGWWRLGEVLPPTAYDFYLLNNGTYQNPGQNSLVQPGAIPVERDGSYNTAMYMMGANYVSVPDSVIFRPAQVTLEAWVRIFTSPTPNTYTIIRKSPNGYRLFIDALGLVSMTIYSSATSSTNAGGRSVVDGKWHHIVGIYDGTAIRIYVDGVLDSTALPSVLVIDYPAGAIRLGSDAVIASEYVGYLDEPAIYGSALSAARIQTHYLTGRPNRAWISLAAYKTAPLGSNTQFKASGTKMVVQRLFAQARS